MKDSEKAFVPLGKELPLQTNVNELAMLPKSKHIARKKAELPKAAAVRSKRKRKKKTPMATLEMILTTKEFHKIEQLPKLLTEEAKILESPPKEPLSVPAINLPKQLPKCITIKPVNSWKAQAENLRKTVEEKLKETHEIEAKVNEYQFDGYEKLHGSACLTPLTCVTQATQTISVGSETVGFVRRSKKTKLLFLTCFDCAAEYELSDWQEYIFHFENVEKCKAKAKKHSKSISKHSLKPALSINTDAVKEYDSPTANDISCDIIEECDISDEENAYFDDDIISNLSLENDDSTTQSTSIINFYKGNYARNLKFLEVLHANPLVWHLRRYGVALYDKAAANFLNEFDNKMKMADLYRSLNNARNLQRSFTTLNSAKVSKLANNPQLKLYIEKLNEIAELSKSFAYYCDYCTYYFLNENDLLKHKLKKHNVVSVSHVCSCGLHFADSEGKDAHEATHNTEPNFTCEHCGLSFFSQKKVENHINLNHPNVFPQPFQCPKCDAKFAKSYMLKWHKLKHDPPRFKCETCGKAYRTAFDYKHHMKSHLNQRDFICEDCGKGYISKDILRKHRFKVHNASEHVCMPCKTYFANKENLHEHMQKYHPNGSNLDYKRKQHAIHVKRYHDRLKAARPCGPGRKPPDLKCKECGMEFGRVGKLRQHKRELGHFLGDTRYKCPHCESILNSDQTFIMHLRKMHELPAKYSDIKYFTPYDDTPEEIIEVMTADMIDESIVQYIDVCVEPNNAVQNINYIDHETDGKKTIAISAVANYEEVQYSLSSEGERPQYLQEY